MSGKVKCTCGWSWNKSDSSKKDMYICHECGRDNSNNMQNGGWLDSYADGGTMQEHQENYNDSYTYAPEGMIGDGFSNVGRNYSPAWGGQFQMGGNIYPVNYVPQAQGGMSMPGATGSMYARIGAPSKGPRRNQTDVTDASAQNGLEMQYYQNGLDWKPKSISKNGSIVKDDNGYWNPKNWGKPVEIGSNDITMEGVYEPLLGVSDTGDTKLMEPGKNYKFKGKKVTEYPVAQDGKTFTKNVDSSLQFQKDWMNSPRYKEMLNKSTENDWIDRDYAEDRLKNLEELTKSKSYNIRESEDEYGPIGEEANSNPDTGVINIYKEGRNLPGEEEENLSHEISHTTDNPRLSMIPYRGRLIPQSDIDLIEKYKPSTYKETGAYLRTTPEGKAQIEKYNLLSQKDINYKTEPTETRARLNVIRQYAKENNIYDPFTQKITPKAYEKLFKNKELLPQGALDLRSIYTKDELIDLLNTVSQNDNQDDYQNIAIAKNGLRQEQKGLVNLDQLTNFTNYNTKQPGGWMDNLM